MDCAYSTKVSELFTKGSQHHKIRLVLITQNLHHQGPSHVIFPYITSIHVFNKVRELATVCFIHCLCTNLTFNKVYYLEVLKRLREKVKRKRPERFANNSWILHHDNVLVHTAQSTRGILATNKITVLEHPAYSPDLAPEDK